MPQKNAILLITVNVLIVSVFLGGLFGGFWLLFRDPIVTLRGSAYPDPANSSISDPQDHASTARHLTSESSIANINEVAAGVNQVAAHNGSGADAKDHEISAEANGSPAHLFHDGGETTWATLHHKLAPAFQTVWPDFQLRYTHPVGEGLSSDTDIKMLLQGQLAFSQSSRPIKPEEYEAAERQGFSLEQIPVAIDGVAIMVNPNLDIPGLTINELKAIYTGQITHWSQVNGPDVPIIPYSRPVEAGGTPHFFVEKVLGNEQLGDTVVLVDDTPQGLQAVATNLGGVYYASASSVVPRCSTKAIPIAPSQEEAFVPLYQAPLVPLDVCPTQRNRLNFKALKSGDYPITRQLFVIVKKDGGLDQQAGEAYAELLLTDEGQQLIREAGFVSIR